jgi:hypothetical protein
VDLKVALNCKTMRAAELARDAALPRGPRAPATDRDGAAPDARNGAAADDANNALSTASSTSDDVVNLNVGGARFTTSLAVLTKVDDSMLGSMFGRCAAMLQPDPVDGSIFIDRDREWFGVVLDFLGGDPPDGPRMQKAMRALPEAAQEAIMRELDFFGLVTAVFGAPPWTDLAAFRPGPEMGSARDACAAVSAGGRVVVVGGFVGVSALNTTLLLDTQTMAFTAGPNLLAKRQGCAAVLLDADRVLVVGGYAGGQYLNTTEILHLSTRTVTPGPTMQTARGWRTAVALDAHRILVVGGVDGRDILSSTEILSLDTMAFAPGPAMATARGGCAAVALDEHRVMVAGGHSGLERLDTTEVLDVRTMAFAPGPSMGSARQHCVAVAVDAQHVLVLGGQDSTGMLATTELLDVAALEFSPGPAMQARRFGSAAARLDTAEGPRIIVVGGHDGRTQLSTTEVLAAAVDNEDE